MGKNKKRNAAARRAQTQKPVEEQAHAPVSAEEVQNPQIPELQVGELKAGDPEPMSSDKAAQDVPETPRKIEDTTADSHETATAGEQHNAVSDEPDSVPVEENAVPTEPLEHEEPSTPLPQPQPEATSEQNTAQGPSIAPELTTAETARVPEPQQQQQPQPDMIAEVPSSNAVPLPQEHHPSPSQDTSFTTAHPEPQLTDQKEVRLEVSSDTTQPHSEPPAAVATVSPPATKHEHCVTIENTRGSLDYSSRNEIVKAVQGTSNAVNDLMESIVPVPLSARPKKQSRVCCSMQ